MLAIWCLKQPAYGMSVFRRCEVIMQPKLNLGTQASRIHTCASAASEVPS